MIWLMLTTLVVVFVIGFRVLTSDSRRAVKRLSERLGITLVPIESMIDQMGRRAGEEFIAWLSRPDEAHLRGAAATLLIWQVCIVDGSDDNMTTWHRRLRKARLAAPLSDALLRQAAVFLRELEPDMQELQLFQARYNVLFAESSGVSWLH
ncbi:DUF1198 family protein [Erwinia sp. CPCC 100877]|nr:DUF1198 family protein [Erwinia sp. CPCC 100877]